MSWSTISQNLEDESVVARHGGEPWHLVSYSSSSKAVHTQLAGVHATASGDVWAVADLMAAVQGLAVRPGQG